VIDDQLEAGAMVITGDIDRDNDMDVVVNQYRYGASTGGIVWYENGGGTPITWTKHTIEPNLRGVGALLLGDIDGDDTLDVAATGDYADAVVWYKNKNAGLTWEKYTIDDNLEDAWGAYIANISGDDRLDIVAIGRSSNKVVWYENNHPTWNKYTIDESLGDANCVAVADFDGDMDLDVTATAKSPGVVVWYENDHPNWNKYTVDENCTDANYLDAADINGDTHPDIVVTTYSSNDVIWYNNLVIDIVEFSNVRPAVFKLNQNYPNPFNPRTIINYELPITNDIELTIYNLTGQKMTTLVHEKQNAGTHQVEWDASGFASGIYYYRIETGEFVDVKKMILIR
jgi:hypothetical protein